MTGRRDQGRGTICLAITPAMKRLGVKNRCRVFKMPDSIPYTMATPRMARYMDASAEINSIYMRCICPEGMHVYSVDECFIDATPYLRLYGMGAKEFAKMLTSKVLEETGITATAGIGTNLFLATGLSETAMAFAGTGMEGSEGWHMAGRSSMECYVELQRARECLEALKTWVYAEELVSGKRG